MLVGMRMSRSPVTVGPNQSIWDAKEIIEKHKFKHIPVVDDGGALVGIVTSSDIWHASPSAASTLSVFELNYLLSRLKVKDIMTQKVLTINADRPIEDAALLMREHHIGGLPVLEDGQLVGMITETDVFRVLIEMLGLHHESRRITLSTPDQVGSLADICKVVADAGVEIVSLVTFDPGENGRGNLVLRVSKNMSQEVLDLLEKHGHNVLDVH